MSNSASARVNSDYSLEFSEPYLIIRSHKRDNTTFNLGCLEGSAELKGCSENSFVTLKCDTCVFVTF